MKNLKTDLPILCLGDANPDLIIPYGDTKINLDLLSKGLPADPSRQSNITVLGGGSIANTASGLGRLGTPVYFAGKVGNDSFGQFCRDDLKNDGVNTDYMVLDPDIPTVIIMAVVDEAKDRYIYIYPENHPSHLMLQKGEIPDELIEKIDWVHTTGFMLRDNPSADTIVEFIEKCHAAGKIVSLDLNLRIENNPMTEEFVSRIMRIVNCSDVLLGSGIEELMPLSGEDTPKKAAQHFAKDRVVVSRFGGDGVEVYHDGKMDFVPCFKSEIADTVGAGDSFNAGFISSVARGDDVVTATRFANGAASYVLGRVGARNMPSRQVVEEYIASAVENK